jgi:hypothetical protein
MKAYLLELEIYPNDKRWHDGLVVGEWHHSNIFWSEEKALAYGKKKMQEQLEKIKLAFADDSLDEIAADKLSYGFVIYEIDSDDQRDNIEMWDRAKRSYDYRGEIIYGENKDGLERFPGDEDEAAGTKFALGSFVTLPNEKHTGCYPHNNKQQIYIIGGVPGDRNKIPHIWENMYILDFIDDDYGYSHTHEHESKIRLYEGEVPADHPLQFLRRLITDEIKASKEVWNDIWYKRIIFDYPPEVRSWREVDFTAGTPFTDSETLYADERLEVVIVHKEIPWEVQVKLADGREAVFNMCAEPIRTEQFSEEETAIITNWLNENDKHMSKVAFAIANVDDIERIEKGPRWE